jgi:uncharacterized protein
MTGAGGDRAARTVDVRDNPDRSRYEVFVDGREAGIAQYRIRDGEMTFTHTEVYPEYRGGPVAMRLAAFALDDARNRGMRVIPACSFIARFIRSHREYRDLAGG